MNAQERAALVALVAAQQFLDPDVERGPESDGWQNTVTVVRDAIAALSALPSGGAEGPTREQMEALPRREMPVMYKYDSPEMAFMLGWGACLTDVLALYDATEPTP